MEKSTYPDEKTLALPVQARPQPPSSRRTLVLSLAAATLIATTLCGPALFSRPGHESSSADSPPSWHDMEALAGYRSAFVDSLDLPESDLAATFPHRPSFPGHKKPPNRKEKEATMLAVPSAESARNASHSCVAPSCPAACSADGV